ncbi:MAG: hypothetical protein EP330_14000 [Deltaproteobacteria bacterium]|nr:MAG: hypothetical protein EP330_14000 [Deltaproteobacteria bacterium]
MSDKQRRTSGSDRSAEQEASAPESGASGPAISNAEAQRQLPPPGLNPSLLESFSTGFGPAIAPPTQEEFMRGNGQLPPKEMPDMVVPGIKGGIHMSPADMQAEIQAERDPGARLRRGLAAIQGGHGLGAMGFMVAQAMGMDHDRSVGAAELTAASGEMIGLHGRSQATRTTGKASGVSGTGPSFGTNKPEK